eukprot:Lithocolla_globosa_v1_NODE_1302_length_2690_cov_16.661860.p1 type:complete len:320 gc:universal NODE_1302_length_2690_cov_16.661860:1167-2126(+)
MSVHSTYATELELTAFKFAYPHVSVNITRKIELKYQNYEPDERCTANEGARLLFSGPTMSGHFELLRIVLKNKCPVLNCDYIISSTKDDVIKKRLRSHSQYNHDLNIVFCYCCLPFQNDIALTNHEDNDCVLPKRLKCNNKCSQRFSGKNPAKYLSYHTCTQQSTQKTSPQISTFLCDYCSFSSTNMYRTEQHMLLKHPEKPFHTCPTCPWKTMCASRLQYHIKIGKHKSEQYKCTFCSYIIQSIYAMEQHIKIKHPDSEIIKCPLCPFQSRYLIRIEEHIDIGKHKNLGGNFVGAKTELELQQEFQKSRRSRIYLFLL